MVSDKIQSSSRESESSVKRTEVLCDFDSYANISESSK